MACKKNGRATRGKKPPRRAGPPKKSAMEQRGQGKTCRRAMWVPKVLVDEGYVKTVPFECDKRGRMKHS
jgi:hypothetical protein